MNKVGMNSACWTGASTHRPGFRRRFGGSVRAVKKRFVPDRWLEGLFAAAALIGRAVGCSFALALLASEMAVLGAAPPLELVAQPDRVELATPRQKLVFTQAADGVFVLTTFVLNGREWRALFDAGRALVEGSSFGLQPTRYAVLTNSPDRKVVEFAGRHQQPDYDWTLLVEASTNSPLFRFVITCPFASPAAAGLSPTRRGVVDETRQPGVSPGPGAGQHLRKCRDSSRLRVPGGLPMGRRARGGSLL